MQYNTDISIIVKKYARNTSFCRAHFTNLSHFLSLFCFAHSHNRKKESARQAKAVYRELYWKTLVENLLHAKRKYLYIFFSILKINAKDNNNKKTAVVIIV